jgi:hypothetical protein
VTATRPARPVPRSGGASIRLVASIPGCPTILDLVILDAMVCREDHDLDNLAQWIELTYRITSAHSKERNAIEHHNHRGSP